MANFVTIDGLKVNEELHRLVRDEIAPGTGVDPQAFWISLGQIVKDLGAKNRQLLAKRKELQKQIDEWCRTRRGEPFDVEEYRAFLIEIGYLVPEGENFQVTTANVDREIAEVSGPQLVVPLDNARYALNAANARWGSLYDALYGTDVIPEADGAEKGEAYNPRRGAKVIARTQAFLDQAVGLERGKFSDVVESSIKESKGETQLIAKLKDGSETGLADRRKFAGFVKKGSDLTSVLLKNNQLHVEIQIDRNHPIGKSDAAGVKDVILEAAITTIQDCEDSVAAVDAADKARVYRDWNGIMKGTLQETFERSGGGIIMRALNPDKIFTAPNGESATLPGRSLLLVRNVGLHMYTDAVTTVDGEEIPEGFLDAMMTALAALHDLKGNSKYINSRTGSVYIVKPKLHGPEEVAATIELFARVEAALGLERNTLKIGIMDEERRTTVNLKEAIRGASERVVFIKFTPAWNWVLCCRRWKSKISRGWVPTKIGTSISVSRPGLWERRRSARGCGPCPKRCAKWSRPKWLILKLEQTPRGSPRRRRLRFTRSITIKSMSRKNRRSSFDAAGRASRTFSLPRFSTEH